MNYKIDKQNGYLNKKYIKRNREKEDKKFVLNEVKIQIIHAPEQLCTPIAHIPCGGYANSNNTEFKICMRANE